MKSLGRTAKLMRIYRAENGLMQEELANQLDISVSMVSRIESGQRLPSAALTKKLIDLTGNPEWTEATLADRTAPVRQPYNKSPRTVQILSWH